IAAIVEFTVASFEGMRSKRWSRDWAIWINQVAGAYGWWPGLLGAVITVAVPVVIMAMLFGLLYAASAFLGHLAALFVLLLMLGPADLNQEIAGHKRDIDLALGGTSSVAEPEFLARGETLDLEDVSGEEAFDPHRGELAALALAADTAWFQPLFWFFVLGPVGAVLYRLCANLRAFAAIEPGVAKRIGELREAMEWVPGRLTVFAMGVAGTLVPVLETARDFGVLRWSVTADLVARASLAAIDHGRVQEVITLDPRVYRINLMHALIKRTLNVWLVIIAGGALLFS
ncbi:MAG: hypothetical protein O7H40_15820, partial [Gammaproteobacteria bacterium]|nr:hypothetical protein [Gammaproteobacteria bacterium]